MGLLDKLKELNEALKRMGTERPRVDPSGFGDPLALKASWSPASPGGANFCTRRLRDLGSGRLEFAPTLTARLGPTMFGLFGLGACLVAPIAALTGNFEPPMLGVFLFGLIFAGVGWFILRSMTKPVVFDFGRALFYRGKPPDLGAPPGEKTSDSAHLHRVKALQLLSEYCSGEKSSFYSYELNLVLDDATRVNVVDHGSLAKLREDAAKLAGILGVPLWDSCQNQ